MSTGNGNNGETALAAADRARLRSILRGPHLRALGIEEYEGIRLQDVLAKGGDIGEADRARLRQIEEAEKERAVAAPVAAPAAAQLPLPEIEDGFVSHW
jgi:hypothetical protein